MYTITATMAELDSLAWLADRYTSAEILYKALCLPSDPDDFTQTEPIELTMSEPDAWDYMLALDREDPGGFIPCLDYDSHLGRSLSELEIV